jgi:hypothetical protein
MLASKNIVMKASLLQNRKAEEMDILTRAYHKKL